MSSSHRFHENEKATVICISTARSGTQLLRQWFEQQQDFLAFGEIMSRSHNYTNILTELSISYTETDNGVGLNGIEKLEKHAASERKTLFFKTFYNHLRARELFSDIGKLTTGRRVIHLIRSNPLRTYFSLVRAHQTNQWKLWWKKPASDKVSIELDALHFKKWLSNRNNGIQNVRKSLIQNKDNFVEVMYRESLDYPDALNKELCETFNRTHNFIPKLQKQNLFSLEEQILNYAEFSSYDCDLIGEPQDDV